MYQFGNGLKYSNLSDRIKTDRHHSLKAVFVDETMIQIDGQDFLLWTAYEPNLLSYLVMIIYQEKGLFLCVINSLCNYEIGMAINQYSQMMALDRTMMMPASSGYG